MHSVTAQSLVLPISKYPIAASPARAGRIRSKFPLRSIAISKRRRRVRLNGACPLDAPDPSERLAKNIRLVAKLRFVRHVLVLAASAASKMRTRGRHALWRGFYDVFQPAANEFFLASGRFNSNELSRKDQRDKHGVAVVMRQAVAAIHKFFYSNFHSGRFPLRGV